MNIKLYYTPKTRSLRPRWLLEELEVPYELVTIDLFGGEGNKPEYRRIHPHGAVPALEVDGQIMLESGAMCQWLADHFSDKQLAPEPGSPERRQYDQWMYYVPGTLEPPYFYYLLHTMILPESNRIPELVPWLEQQFPARLKVLNTALENKSYLMGDHFTAADIMVGSTLMWLPQYLEDYPALTDYVRTLQARAKYEIASG